MYVKSVERDHLNISLIKMDFLRLINIYSVSSIPHIRLQIFEMYISLLTIITTFYRF